MKMRMLFWLSCVGLLASPIFADMDRMIPEEQGQESASLTSFTGVGLAVIGHLAESDLERVREFAERNTSIPVRVRELTDSLPAAGAENLGEVADKWAPYRNPEDAAFVLLYAGSEEFSEHTVYRYDARTGIVNVTLLQTDDEEQFMRRVEKLTMRSLGLLLDVPPVPNPQSAMWTYSNLEELDWMGRNFDPPSLRVIQVNATKLGIDLIADSPFLMIR